jgi:predicted amidohydrolase YtcJ
MDVDVLDVTLEALEAAPAPPGTFHRVEHCALTLPEQVRRLAGSGAAVVVNPSFLLHRAEKYRRRLSEVEQAWLQPTRSLLAAGVTVRAGSDSPVVPADPVEILRSARHRDLGPDEALAEEQAATLLTPF